MATARTVDELNSLERKTNESPTKYGILHITAQIGCMHRLKNLKDILDVNTALEQKKQHSIVYKECNRTTFIRRRSGLYRIENGRDNVMYKQTLDNQ